MQFPPIDKLRALATVPNPAPDLEVFAFLEQFSIAWYDLGIKALKWDGLKRKKGARRIDRALAADGISEAEISDIIELSPFQDENKKRFFELACTWIQQHHPGYFQKVVEIAEAIARFEVPEPESSIVSLNCRLWHGAIMRDKFLNIKF